MLICIRASAILPNGTQQILSRLSCVRLLEDDPQVPGPKNPLENRPSIDPENALARFLKTEIGGPDSMETRRGLLSYIYGLHSSFRIVLSQLNFRR